MHLNSTAVNFNLDRMVWMSISERAVIIKNAAQSTSQWGNLMAVISLSGFSVYLKMHLDQLFYCYEDEGKRSHWQVPHASNYADLLYNELSDACR